MKAVSGSLVRRLSMAAAVWVGVLGLTVAALALWQYWRASIRAVDAALQADALALIERISVSEDLLEIELEAPAAPRTAGPGDERYHAVYDRAGRLIDRSSPLVPDALVREPARRTRDGYRELVTAAPHQSMVLVGWAIDGIYADMQRLAVSLILASAAGAGLALGVGVWLRRALARSVLQIGRTAQSLAPGQPTRIDTRQIDEEFAGVAAALNGAFDRLEQALVRERRLTSDASHELRTPVTTLVAETQWALGQPRTAAEYVRSLEVCARQGTRMKGLVESLLTLAGLDAASHSRAGQDLSLHGLAQEVAGDLSALATDHGVEISVTGDAAARADREQLRILLANLLTNAIRYNHRGGAARIVIGAANGRAVVRVEDTGRGLDPALGSQVFERFWRADAARAARDGGSGLGLAIVKAIVDAQGGTIRFERAAPEGTAFIVELPGPGARPAEAAGGRAD